MKFPEWIKIYGNLDFRGKCETESWELMAFFQKCDEELAFHPKNEGKRTARQAAFDKARGMTRSVPDIIIPGCPTFVCELKRRDHTASSWQDGQIDYLKRSFERGAFICVALGHEAALEALKEWQDLGR